MIISKLFFIVAGWTILPTYHLKFGLPGTHLETTLSNNHTGEFRCNVNITTFQRTRGDKPAFCAAHGELGYLVVDCENRLPSTACRPDGLRNTTNSSQPIGAHPLVYKMVSPSAL